MALGESIFRKKGNYNNRRSNSINVYPDIKFTNTEPENQMAPTSLYFSYWNNCLVFSIAPVEKIPGKDFVAANNERAIKCYLKYTKASILSSVIKRFIASDGAIKNEGVQSGDCIVGVSNGKEYGVESPCLFIKKANEKGDSIADEIVFICRTDLYSSISNFDNSTMKGDTNKEEYKYMDLEVVCKMLDEFVNSMTYAQAYAANNAYRNVNDDLLSMVNSIGEKVGINGFSSGNNYSSGRSEATFTKGTLDDL